MRRQAIGCWVVAAGLLLSACDLAPVYTPPHLLLPDNYQGSAPFELARPDARLLPQGDWWTLFADPDLNRLEASLAEANPTLQGAVEQYTQARDLAAEAQSQLYPQISAGGQLSDNRESADRLFGSTGVTQYVQAETLLQGTASWEPDFWDQLRNGARQKERLAQSSAADLATVRLSLQAELASDYFAVRGLDDILEVLTQSIAAYGKTVEVAQLRYGGGIASELDLARARNQLANAEVQRTETSLQRDLMQHAVAALVGAIPSSFVLPRTAQEPEFTAPPIPLGLPSTLLERRPDIASAERRMAAANASIGVSRAAFYPNINVFGAAGLEATSFNLINLPNSLWSIGAGAMLPLFEGGLRRAELRRSWSQYAQTRDDYRATVLAAFREVEDGLSSTQRLTNEVAHQHEASSQAALALSISTTLYEAGLDSYLSVSVAQVAALSAQTSEVQVEVRERQAAVALIRAIGGGWDARDLPGEKQTLPLGPLDYGVPPHP